MGTEVSKSENQSSASPHHPLESSLSRSNVFRLHDTPPMYQESSSLSQRKRYTPTNQKREVFVLNSAELITQSQQHNTNNNINRYGECNIDSSKSNSITNKNNVYLSLPVLPNQKSSFARSKEISPIATSIPGISCKSMMSNSNTLKNNSLPSLSNTSMANSKDNLEKSSNTINRESKSHDNACKYNVLSPSSLILAEKRSNYICDKSMSNSNNSSKEQQTTINKCNESSEDTREDWLAATESKLVLEWNWKRREKEQEIENEPLKSWSENYLPHSGRQQRKHHRHEHKNGLSDDYSTNIYNKQNNITTNNAYILCEYNNTECNNAKKNIRGNHKMKQEQESKYNESNWKSNEQWLSFSRFKYSSSSNSSSSSSSNSSSSSLFSEEEVLSEMKLTQSTNEETETKLSETNDNKIETSTPHVPVECDAVPFPFNRSTGVIYKIDNTHDSNNNNNKINHNVNTNNSHLANMSNAAYPKVQLKEIPVGEQYYEALRDAWRQPSERGALLHPSRQFVSQFVHEIITEVSDKDRTKEFSQPVPLQPIIGVLCRNWEEEGLYDQVYEIYKRFASLSY